MTIIMDSKSTFDGISAAFPTTDGVAIGNPAVGADGRHAIAHPFSEADIAAIKAVADAWVAEHGGSVAYLDSGLPDDWQWPEAEALA